MKKLLQIITGIMLLVLLFPAFGWTQSPQSVLLDGETWKTQGLESIMPAWIENGIDSTDGQFYAFMDRRWKPSDENLKYPGMISRQLFSLSTAYMLSGQQRYIEKAERMYNYLIENGWDREYGGWHYAINPQGNAVDSKKDLFMNIYAVTGLTMYYMVTHNEEAMKYIEQSRSLLRKHAWDQNHGGYYKSLDRRWEVTDSTKAFTPQAAPISGYLLYLYSATRNQDYLDESKQLMSLVKEHMQDSETGWIRERFTADWEPLPKNKDERIDIGHNIEISWMWLRLYGITKKNSYLKDAQELYQKLQQAAYLTNGAWLHKIELRNMNEYPKTTNWWIQAYGTIFQLPMYHYGKMKSALKNFRKGSTFWNKAFVDEKYGGTMLSAKLDGAVDRGDKAVRTKTSYHAMELALLNYLSLNLWVNQKPVTLYFHFDENRDKEPLCPLPIYDSEAEITEVSIDGENIKQLSKNYEPCISIPEGSKNIKVKMK